MNKPSQKKKKFHINPNYLNKWTNKKDEQIKHVKDMITHESHHSQSHSQLPDEIKKRQK